MKHSAELDKLALALNKAQAVFKGASKDTENPFLKSKYADLRSVWEACREGLVNNGLSVAQGFGTDEKDGFIWTLLMHSSGQWLQGECALILTKRDPQTMGAASTYARRYGLAAILGITQEDDDAQSAMPKRDTKVQAPRSETPPPADLAAASEEAKRWEKALKDCITPTEVHDIWTKVPAAYKGPLFDTKVARIKELTSSKAA